MPVRLLKPYEGQAAGTLYFGANEEALRSTGIADDNVELATDYQSDARIVTAATANTVRTARVYRFNSASGQTITVGQSGYWPVGTVLSFVQQGMGNFTIVAGTGITIQTAASSLVSKGQYSLAQLLKIGPTTWLAYGNLGG